MCFEVRKEVKRHQEIKIEKNQVRNRSRKNQIIRFVKPKYPSFFRIDRVRVGFEIYFI
jgi:uncharacterized membrane protein